MNDKALESFSLYISKMPDYNEAKSYGEGFLELKMIKGEALTWCILKVLGYIAIAKTYISNNSVFPPHSHPETEIITVYKGELAIVLIDEEGKETDRVFLGVADSYVIKPNQHHYAFTKAESTRIIAQTIPDSKGFPDEY